MIDCGIFMLWLFSYPLMHQILNLFAGEVVSNHDELMSNFFAQPDALADGKVDFILVSFGCFGHSTY